MGDTELLTAKGVVEHMNRLGSGSMAGNGKCVWLRHDTENGPRYSGGAWYSDDCYGFGPDVVVVHVPWSSMPSRRLTLDEFQDLASR